MKDKVYLCPVGQPDQKDKLDDEYLVNFEKVNFHVLPTHVFGYFEFLTREKKYIEEFAGNRYRLIIISGESSICNHDIKVTNEWIYELSKDGKSVGRLKFSS